MAKTRTRKSRPAAPVDPRLEAKRAEKQMLARALREVRTVNRLAGQLKRAIERCDAELAHVWIWLGGRAERIGDAGPERTGTEG